MFDSLSARFTSAFSSLRSRGKISAADLDSTYAEIKQALLESDVALEVVEAFIAEVSEKSNQALSTIQSGSNQANAIFDVVNSSLVEILGGAARRVRFSKNPPTVIMLAGLQGAGKTTLAGKLAKFYADQGNTPLLVAADLQRPNAVTQLQVVGESINVPVFAPEPGNGVGDPVKTAKAGVEFAKSKQYNMVIVDTAGRLGIDADLMKEASDIRDAVKPDEILFVVDAMIGQDAVRTSQAFLNGVGFDGVVLTKLDGDARGGAALSIASLTKRPIMFASTGEKLSDFDIFYPERMASRILGMGDVATLAEQAKKAFDSDKSAKLEAKFASGEDFTLEDFLDQLSAMSKMGSMSKLMGMLPGGGQMKQLTKGANFDESEIVRTKAIIQSMTPRERQEPKVLNGSRRARIALGAGLKVSDVNNLVDRFSAAQKMMRQIRNGGVPAGMAGMGMPAMAPKPANIPPKKKSKSGNPAKRALEESQ
ncbi:MAG: signal recognition particle protein [Actinobacteria bacterium]|uniref:signal-recognition-particle GTPase n=1 Tax=freshwater metagenome TaxID=449393 RepID=A0A6J7DV58_9ZZZZ|nr:signal recognition particle protein [Actinomycetota bacterium]